MTFCAQGKPGHVSSVLSVRTETGVVSTRWAPTGRTGPVSLHEPESGTSSDAPPSATEISPGRYSLELSLDQTPDRILAELTASGASLVSLNPMRDTLEDFFMKHVAEMGTGARPPRAEDVRASR